MDDAKLSLSLATPLYVRHLEQEPWMNKDIKGLGVEYGPWSIASYKNTQGKNTLYGGYKKKLYEDGPFSFGGKLGLATGYEKAPVLPVAALSAEYNHPSGWGGEVNFIPNPLDMSTSAFAAILRKRIK